jgi:hypothetical protein
MNHPILFFSIQVDNAKDGARPNFPRQLLKFITIENYTSDPAQFGAVGFRAIMRNAR